jgi:2-polyprenyl-3-methyl-5-hydroxy-6-metoxy-1,4-benzoquinol methylase
VVLFCEEVERVSESDGAEQPKYWVDVEGSGNHRAQLDLIPPGSRVLEIGAGPGHMSQALMAKGCTVTAVERDEALAALARQVCRSVIVTDVESPAFEELLAEERFDVVLLGDVLEHLKGPEEFLVRLQARLTPHGCLVVCLPNVAHGAVRLSLLEGRFEYQAEGLLDRTHLKFFTLSSILETFGATGYAVSGLQRIRCGFFATEFRLDPAHVPPDALRLLCRDPEATTYQFVFRAFPEGQAPGAPAQVPISAEEPLAACQLTTAVLHDYERWGRESLFGRPPDLRRARRLYYCAFRLAPSLWRLCRLLVMFLPYPVIDGLGRLYDVAHWRRASR